MAPLSRPFRRPPNGLPAPKTGSHMPITHTWATCTWYSIDSGCKIRAGPGNLHVSQAPAAAGLRPHSEGVGRGSGSQAPSSAPCPWWTRPCLVTGLSQDAIGGPEFPSVSRGSQEVRKPAGAGRWSTRDAHAAPRLLLAPAQPASPCPGLGGGEQGE